jgi:hypothetical protein
VEYITVLGKAGTYGEYKVESWQDMSRRDIAAIQYNKDGTYSVTLCTAKHIRHTRTLADLKTARAVCEAHVKERGFTKLHGEYADVRAYND